MGLESFKTEGPRTKTKSKTKSAKEQAGQTQSDESTVHIPVGVDIDTSMVPEDIEVCEVKPKLIFGHVSDVWDIGDDKLYESPIGKSDVNNLVWLGGSEYQGEKLSDSDDPVDELSEDHIVWCCDDCNFKSSSQKQLYREEILKRMDDGQPDDWVVELKQKGYEASDEVNIYEFLHDESKDILKQIENSDSSDGSDTSGYSSYDEYQDESDQGSGLESFMT